MKNLTHIKELNFDLFNRYKQIAIFIQTRNDLDTCCCALSLADLIKENIGDIKIGIYAYTGGSKFLRKDIEPYRYVKMDWDKNVLVVFSEICGTNEISKDNLELVKKAKEILVIDHHIYEKENENHNALMESISIVPTRVLHGLFSSSCEVLLDAISKPESKWKISKRTAEMIFMGLYSDTSELRNAKASTFKHIDYLTSKCQIDAGKIITLLKQRPLSHLRLFADVVKEGWFSNNGNLMFLQLYPKEVQKHLPRHLIREKGELKRKQMLTWIPRWAEELSNANTIIFSHYSLFEPYNVNRRITYIILQKENPALEHILRIQGFKQVKNRWNKEMPKADLIDLIEKYQELFTA